jgi:hypothetical protein
MVWHIFARLTRLIAQQHVDLSAPWGRRIPAQGNALGIRHATPVRSEGTPHTNASPPRHPTPCGVPTGRGKRVGPHSKGRTPGWYVDAPLGRGIVRRGHGNALQTVLEIARHHVRGWVQGANGPNHFPVVSSEFKRPNMQDQDACHWSRTISCVAPRRGVGGR